MATAIANKMGRLSIIAPPAAMSKAAIGLCIPHPVGSIQYPIPLSSAAMGMIETGNMSDLPNLCKYFIANSFSKRLRIIPNNAKQTHTVKIIIHLSSQNS